MMDDKGFWGMIIFCTIFLMCAEVVIAFAEFLARIAEAIESSEVGGLLTTIVNLLNKGD